MAAWRTTTLVPTGTRSKRSITSRLTRRKHPDETAWPIVSRLVGAVDAVDRLAEIERARAHRIARAAGHEARQVGLALDHLRRRPPVGPFLLARYFEQALPLEAVAADADAVADGAVAALHEVEEALLGVDDDGAGRLVGSEEDRLRPVLRRQHLLFGRRDVAGLFEDLQLLGLDRCCGIGMNCEQNKQCKQGG